MKVLNIIGFFLLFLPLTSRATPHEIPTLDSMEDYYELIQISSLEVIEQLFLAHRLMPASEHEKIRLALMKQSRENLGFIANPRHLGRRPCDRFIMRENMSAYTIELLNLNDCLFLEVHFHGGGILDANIIKTKFIGCEFNNFTMKNSSIDADFSDCIFNNGAIESCGLSNILFHQNHLHETAIKNSEFCGSNCRYTFFDRCKIDDSNFENANMEEAIIEGGSWSNTTFENSWLDQMELRNPILINSVNWDAKYKRIFACHINNEYQIIKETIYNLAYWENFNTLNGVIDESLASRALRNFLVEVYER